VFDGPDYYPLTDAELAAINPSIQFVGERILHAPDVEFMGTKWTTILGTVHGSIYKIAIQRTGVRSEAGALYMSLVRYCIQQYGESKDMVLWDTSNGNVVITNSNLGDAGTVNVFLTSRKVSEYQRI
jgi:hypothetical protein